MPVFALARHACAFNRSGAAGECAVTVWHPADPARLRTAAARLAELVAGEHLSEAAAHHVCRIWAAGNSGLQARLWWRVADFVATHKLAACLPRRRSPRDPLYRTAADAKRALQAAVGAIYAAPLVSRRAVLQRHAVVVAQYVGADLLGEEEATRTLFDNARGSGLAAEEVRATLRQAFAIGFQHPFER